MDRPAPAIARSFGTRVRRECLRLLARTGQLWRVNFAVAARIDGRAVRVPLLYGQGAQNLALLEPGLLTAFKRIFARAPGAFVDVGMNAGQTLLKVKVADPARRYVAFETNPRCCQYVDELIRVNRFDGCTIVPAGLSDRTGLVRLWLRQNVGFDPAATTVDDVWDDAGSRRAQYAAVYRGDDVLPTLGLERIAVIKIDTEGAEREVLAGLSATIARCRPFIVCEILPVGDPGTATGSRRVERQRDVQALLREWQYAIFRLHADARLETIADIGVHDDLALTNYLFVPRELAREVACGW
jgi:FkbM family methyltransferase